MITELLLSFFLGIAELFVNLLPEIEPPAWLSDGSGYLSTIWASAAGLGVWIPWSLAGIVVAAVLASNGVGLGIKLVRIVASFFTAGGGSAA